MAESLFDKYGGFDTFTRVVDRFYQKVLDNERLEHYFRDVELDSLIFHQTHFIAKALGGPDIYEGRDLRQVHVNLGISILEFNEVVELLEEALEETGVESLDIDSILSLIVGLKDQIVVHS